MKLHPRHNVVSLAEGDWAYTESGQARYNYADLFVAFIAHGAFPCKPEDALMVEAMHRDFNAVCEKNELTEGERVMLIGSILQTNAKYLIRMERHGDANKPGGLV